MEWKGSVSYHLGMISYGIMGTAFGLLPLERVAGFARKWLIVVPLYCLYRTGGYFIGEPYAMQLTGVVTGLLMLYSLALALPPKTHVYRQVVLLGRYSLFGYIIQLRNHSGHRRNLWTVRHAARGLDPDGGGTGRHLGRHIYHRSAETKSTLR